MLLKKGEREREDNTLLQKDKGLSKREREREREENTLLHKDTDLSKREWERIILYYTRIQI